MNKLLPNPIGLDYHIQALQVRLYAKLCALWGVTDSSYQCWGRAYRNHTKDGYIPQCYDPGSNSYVDFSGAGNDGGMFFDDKFAAMSFFALDDPMKRESNRDEVAKVQLLMFVNLNSITPGGIVAGTAPGQQQGQRLDEVCINDVKNFLRPSGCQLIIKESYRNIDKVLERYSGGLKRQALNDNRHPKFCFRIDFELRYNPSLNS